MREEVSCLAGGVRPVDTDTFVQHFRCLVELSLIDEPAKTGWRADIEILAVISASARNFISEKVELEHWISDIYQVIAVFWGLVIGSHLSTRAQPFLSVITPFN